MPGADYFLKNVDGKDQEIMPEFMGSSSIETEIPDKLENEK